MDFEVHARRLQDIGLNAYESRAYLVLIGHQHFKALEVAGRANIPRQKIYEVLDSLIEKGFVQVVQGKAKQFSAVEPQLALEGYLVRRKEAFERQWQERQRLAGLLQGDLAAVFADGNQGRGPLDYLRIVADNAQIAEEYRRLLVQSSQEYLEFAKPPFAVDPVAEPMVEQLAAKGVPCQLLFDKRVLDTKGEREKLDRLATAGAEVKLADALPMKLALFDQRRGMISLDDPVVSHPQITALVFDHESLASAMSSLFSEFWKRGKPL
jgi:sugar-specific transcriptional regulator TrmB